MLSPLGYRMLEHMKQTDRRESVLNQTSPQKAKAGWIENVHRRKTPQVLSAKPTAPFTSPISLGFVKRVFSQQETFTAWFRFCVCVCTYR